MPRKQKFSRIEKEYGVKSSKFHQLDNSFQKNQIVQLNISEKEMSQQDDLLKYNPKIPDPQGLEESNIDNFQKIPQRKQKNQETTNIKEFNDLVQKKNNKIEEELQRHNQLYREVKMDQMIQWIDLVNSKAFMQQKQMINIPCYWCLEKFNNISWPLVVGRNKYGKFKVRGHHCSPNCALANGMDSREISETIPVSNLYSWMQAFVYKVTGNYDTIRPSPPRMMLEKFGGSMTLKQFRLESKMKNYNSYLTYPPLETSLSIWNRVRSEEDIKEDEDNELVLKRKTPFYDQEQSLDQIWNIKTLK